MCPWNTDAPFGRQMDGRTYESYIVGLFPLMFALWGKPHKTWLYSVKDTLVSPFYGIKLVNMQIRNPLQKYNQKRLIG